MAIPNQNTPELDLRNIILDISTANAWGLTASQVKVGGFTDDFYGAPFQVVVKTVLSDMNPKWQFDNFTIIVLVYGFNEKSKQDVANASWAIHNALVGSDTIYITNDGELEPNRCYVNWGSNVAPSDSGSSAAGRPLYIARITVNRQILVDENNRKAL